MSNIIIARLYDDNDCEACGGSYAEGFAVTVDGKEFGNYEPRAHCFSVVEYSLENVLADLLTHFGHEIEIKDGEE